MEAQAAALADYPLPEELPSRSASRLHRGLNCIRQRFVIEFGSLLTQLVKLLALLLNIDTAKFWQQAHLDLVGKRDGNSITYAFDFWIGCNVGHQP